MSLYDAADIESRNAINRRAWAGLAKDKATPAPKVAKVAKPSKYRNVKTEVDGIKFDSKKEALTYAGLKLAEKMGEIEYLALQPKFVLLKPQKREDGTMERGVAYIADFDYFQAGRRVVVDCKGMKTPDYIIKRKLLLFVHGITITEV